jgi:hypothetical protein
MIKPKIGDRIGFSKSSNTKGELKEGIVALESTFTKEFILIETLENKSNSDLWSGERLRKSTTHGPYSQKLDNTDIRKYDFVRLEDITSKKIPRTRIAERLYKNNILSETKDYLTISYKE